MSHENESRGRIPATISANLEARLAPYPNLARSERGLRLGLIKDLKLLFAALGAGNAVVPLGDNSRTARLLSEYANALRTN
jgi:hypothetical protein